jgi:hypothetical protein
MVRTDPDEVSSVLKQMLYFWLLSWREPTAFATQLKDLTLPVEAVKYWRHSEGANKQQINKFKLISIPKLVFNNNVWC